MTEPRWAGRIYRENIALLSHCGTEPDEVRTLIDFKNSRDGSITYGLLLERKDALRRDER